MMIAFYIDRATKVSIFWKGKTHEYKD